MWRNCLAASIKSLARNWLFSALSVTGLALGLATAILTGLYVRDELSFDRFIPGHDHVYVVASTVHAPGHPDVVTDYTPLQIAPALRLTFPQVKAAARLAYARMDVQRARIQASESGAWVDPAFFEILPLPALAGDPRAAIRDPAGVVITRSLAMKYFGRATPLGETLLIDHRHSLKVEAVIADLPPETHLTQSLFASGLAPFSAQVLANDPQLTQGFQNILVDASATDRPQVDVVRSRLYLRIDRPAEAQAVAGGLARFVRPFATSISWLNPSQTVSLSLVPLGGLHTYPFRGSTLGAVDRQADLATLSAVSVIAALVIALAGANFVNLSIARASRRAVEVGVRKTAGASRGDLFAQFMIEAMGHVLIAMMLAMCLVELSLPSFNAFLGRSISFAYWRDPEIAVSLVAAVVVLCAAAGFYPALVLSSLRPSAVIKGWASGFTGGANLSNLLVVCQFSVLVLLMIVAGVIWRQTRFGLTEGLRLDRDQVLVITTTPCRGAFLDAVRETPGVRGATCSSHAVLGLSEFRPMFESRSRVAGGPWALTSIEIVDYGFFDQYGVRPIAGRVFSRAHPSDDPPSLRGDPLSGSIVVNQAAAHSLGFGDAARAVGRTLTFDGDDSRPQIVGVVPDFTVDLAHAAAKPQFFTMDFYSYPFDQVMSVKLDRERLPETLASIDRLWRATGHTEPIRRQFLDAYVNSLYLDTIRLGSLVGVQSAVALMLACLGLLGLAMITAEQRTKEIGVRKAMGAGAVDIGGLLLWRFSQPVLWANLVAWPTAWLVMNAWLQGFAYHVDLSPWTLLAASAAALAIAWATVSVQSWLVARAKPVLALRYE